MTDAVTLLDVVLQAMRDFERAGARVALVGGLAVGARARERTTRDADFVVAVTDDDAAERLVRELRARGYGIQAMLEHTERGRLATVRFTSPLDGVTMVDALFASSGVEEEIVAAAELIDVGAGVMCPVARVGHLIALKALARSERRVQDDEDLGALVHHAADEELARARAAVRHIEERGYGRGKQLAAELEQQIARWAAR